VGNAPCGSIENTARRIARKFKGIVKYDGNINKVYKEPKDSQTIAEQSSAIIQKLYGDRIACGDKVAAGSAFGLDVTMYYWIIRPVG
jgi:hypothetical protein